MDPESKKMLQETLAFAEENNKILHKIRGFQRREAIWRVLRVLVIVAIAFGSFYFLEPYLDKVTGFYESIMGGEEKTNNSPIQDFLKGL